MFKRIDDPDWAVRHQLAATLGTFRRGRPARETTALVTLLERFGNDPLTVDAAAERLSGPRRRYCERLLQTSGADAAADRRDHDARGDARQGGAGSSVQNVLQWIAEDSRPGMAAPGAARRD